LTLNLNVMTGIWKGGKPEFACILSYLVIPLMGTCQMNALKKEKKSRSRLSDILTQNTDGPQLRSNKTRYLSRGFAALSLIGSLALFTQSDQQADTPNSVIFTLSKFISDFICPHLNAQFPLPSDTYSKMLAFLLYDPENKNEHLMLSSGDKVTDITGSINAKGLVSIQDICMVESGNVICAAFDTTDSRHNWEIIRVTPSGGVSRLTNTAELDESSPSMSNDQNKLAYVADGSVYVEEDGNKIKLTPNRLRTYLEVKWTPEDRLLVTVQERRKSYIAEIDLANPYFVNRLTYSENKVVIRNPAISPDGRNLVYLSEKGGDTEIVIVDRYGNSSRILSFGDNIIYSDSSTIVYSREFNSRSHLFFTNESGSELEAIIPAMINNSGFFIRSISTYTPYIIPPETPEESGIEGDLESKDTQPAGVPNTRKGYRLSKNYPNPFNPITTIQYEISFINYVRLEILNIRGQLIRTLVDGQKAPGRYSVEFDARGIGSGVYLYKLVAGDYTQTRKMVLMK